MESDKLAAAPELLKALREIADHPGMWSGWAIATCGLDLIYKYDMTRDDEGEYVKQSTWKAFVAFQNGFVDGYEAGCRESNHECVREEKL